MPVQPDKKTYTASQTLSEVFAGEETRVLDTEKLSAGKREKSCFVRSLETMSANDIAEPAEGKKKKKLTAAFVTRLSAFLVCFAVFGVSLYMIVERVIDDIQTDRRRARGAADEPHAAAYAGLYASRGDAFRRDRAACGRSHQCRL